MVNGFEGKEKRDTRDLSEISALVEQGGNASNRFLEDLAAFQPQV